MFPTSIDSHYLFYEQNGLRSLYQFFSYLLLLSPPFHSFSFFLSNFFPFFFFFRVSFLLGVFLLFSY